MKGQIILTGYDENAADKLLIIEAEKDKEDKIDVVRFPQLKVTIDCQLLLNAIEFLRTH